MKQFKETGQSLQQFSYLFLVHCPRCDGCASVVLRDGRPQKQENVPFVKGSAGPFLPRRLVCAQCGYVKDWDGQEIPMYDPHDWYFRQPLWLQIACCGEVLWALNKEHLDFLEEFISAGLREAYPNGTMASRLPEWMKSAKNREAVLKCIRKLRAMLPTTNDP